MSDEDEVEHVRVVDDQPSQCSCDSLEWPFGFNTVCSEFNPYDDETDRCKTCDHGAKCHG